MNSANNQWAKMEAGSQITAQPTPSLQVCQMGAEYSPKPFAHA